MMSKRSIFCLTLLTALLFACACGAEEQSGALSISAADTISSYQTTPVSVGVPGEGFLRVKVEQMGAQTTIWSGEVSGGQVSFDWDGLLSYGELLHRGQSAQLVAEWTDREGKSLVAQKSFSVGAPECRVQFAVSSRETIYAPDPLYQVDVKLSAKGELHYTVCPAEEPSRKVASGTRWVKNPDIVEVIRWRGILNNGNYAPAGEYVLTFWPGNREDLSIRVPVTVSETRAKAIPVEVTDLWADRIPVTPEELKAFFSSPVAVMDGLEGSGTPVFEAPSANSKKLGNVHGATVSVRVIEPNAGNGWAKVGFYRYGDGTYQEGYLRRDALTMVRPSGRYGLIADLKSQTMYVFEDGLLTGTLRFSSALPGLKVETCCGVFLTGLRMENFKEEDFQYDYVIRIDGSNLLHQIGYRVKGEVSFSEQHALLGQPASHGCIRMAETPDENGKGLTAWWIYSRIPKRTVLIVVDDYAQRIAEAMERGQVNPATPAPAGGF